ncbi:MAG: DUF3500 domain-containing protein [Bacteroidetes bacterium]|jgi:hypothetical protein|nr:MAG: DUF3500 domain-containing protein [Bacteroidota bacterium]
MNRLIVLALYLTVNFSACRSQPPAISSTTPREAAVNFLGSLSANQKKQAQFLFSDDERYNWHFIPKSRKGIPLKDLNAAQRNTAFSLLRMTMSDTGYRKATAIIELEDILRESENRPVGDEYRDKGKYYFSIFGDPAVDSIWGWRLEGHHVSLNFSSENNRLISGTPGFLGTNPAIVLSGPEKGRQILQDETVLGLSLIQSLDEQQKKKAIISSEAPGDIITSNSRKAMINDPKGILYGELNSTQQRLFMQLLSIYIHRYTNLLAKIMMNEIETAGLNNLRFAWAGDQQTGVGHPNYYRIQGPTLIIEYDNTQNNANHVHTVLRDLKNDFGGDELLEHYNNSRHQ